MYCESGNGKAAERIFRLIEERHAPPEGIRLLIGTLRENGCIRVVTKPQETGLLQLRVQAGYDSNPNLGLGLSRIGLILDGQSVMLPLDDTSRPQGDAWQSADLLWLAPGVGWQPFVLGAVRAYRHESEYDRLLLVAGLQQQEEGRRLRIAAGVQTLDGQFNQASLMAHAQHPLPWASDLAAGLAASLLYYPDLAEQNSVQLEPQLIFERALSAAWHTRLSVGLLLDQPSGARPGGLRHGLNLLGEARAHLMGPWYFESFLRFQALREDEPYSPLFGQTRRDGQEWLLGLSLGHRLDADNRLSLNVMFQQGSDSIPLYIYQRNQVSLMLETNFR